MLRCFLLTLLGLGPLQAQLLIDTYAGGAIPSGVPAQSVSLGNVTGIAWDPDGNIVFADSTNNVIRRIGTDGIITTIVGTGESGFAGDGGPASKALIDISNPAVCHYDASGNLYFFDARNYRIRRVDAKGVITSVAGNGQQYISGLDIEGPAAARSLGQVFDLTTDPSGNLYFSIGGDNHIFRVGTDGNLGVFVQLPPVNPLQPVFTPLATDSHGNVYFFSPTLFPLTLLKASPTGVISTFTTFPSSSPPSVALKSDLAGNIYTFVDGQLLRYAEDGTVTAMPTQPRLPFATSINVQGQGAFLSTLFPNPANHVGLTVVQTFSEIGGLITVAGGNPQAAPDDTPLKAAWFIGSVSFAIGHSGEFYIADLGACTIRKIGADVLSTFAGTGICGADVPSGNARTANLGNPISVAVDSKNNVWVADYNSNLYSISQDGTISHAISTKFTGGQGAIAIDGKDRVYSVNTSSLTRYLADGTAQQFGGGYGIGVDSSGKVYLDSGGTLYAVNDDGSLTLSVSGFPVAQGLAFDPSGNVWGSGGVLVTANSSGIAKVGAQVGYSGDGGPAQSARMIADGSVAFGADGILYFLDWGFRIRRVRGTGPSATPIISQNGVVNAVSYKGGSIAAGELISIFGSNFGVAALQVNRVVNNSIPLGIGRTKVFFNGLPGAITAITPTQINVFVPSAVATPVNIRVEVDNILSPPFSIPLVAAAPGISPSILNQDGTLNSASNPAPRGSVVSLFGTGLGKMTPQLNDGNLAISTPYSTPISSPTLTIGGQLSQILYLGDAPTLPTGVFQLNAPIPAASTPGSVPVSLMIGGVSTQIAVFIAP